MSFKVEDIDIDAYLNLDGNFYSPSLANLNKGKGIEAPQFQQPPIEKINTYAPFQTSQTFSGPSRQYDSHKQHIPLPPGALANSLAIAENIFPFHGYQDYSMGSNSGFFGEEFVDFSSAKDHRSSYGGSNDMDMDFESPLNGTYIDPSAMGGHEEDSPTPARAEIVRVYPGMHAHQAEQAALAKQQQQKEIQQRQSLKASQRFQSQTTNKPSGSKGINKAPVDPAVEERISRLLNQMRQTANISTETTTQEHSPSSSISKSKKEEEDMDEDERLLASEEGKKLSSKERRQLRNKVSARAFRSRRKEYIGQLEGEVAQKASEADILREENEALKAENTRLTDLSKLLLSSPAFSSFLNDLSTNGLPASISAQNQSSQSVTQQPQSQIPKFATPQPSINTITEEELDFNSLEGNSNWQSGIDFNAAPQVFAVIDIPEGPVIDIDALAAKPAIFSECQRQDKNTVPIFKPAPTTDHVKQQYVCDDSIEMDESDPAFALYADLPTKFSEPECQDSGSIQFEKATETFELVCYNEENSEQDGEAVSSATMARFEHLCSCLDSLSLRLESFVSRQ